MADGKNRNGSESRETRLAAALRANLRRRKAQARGQMSTPADPDAPAGRDADG